ncbi:DUF5677 domain-containing protein [Hymenobacter cavernae]|uniref:AbiV family abortive infection protein n=1 Tax=Hymenobacter cavernae TaxID=2044852 RepID=A0ABQ1UBZ3_9BACT|nr:DUF5677 domain-containing protein [Hymenobacter cavernae]GGF14200.1 hypothetical protein GCM10011383_26840 [Hymenobacter cavernae]
MNASEISQLKKEVIKRAVSEFKESQGTIYDMMCDSEVYFKLGPLIDFIISRAIRVNQLTKQGSIEDAEILFRSMLEGFMKLLYIITAETDDEYKERVKEYYIILGDIERLRSSDKYKVLVEAKINNELDPYSKLILTLEEEEALKQKESWSNRKYRQQVKAKWSYSELSKYLADSLKGGVFVPLVLLDHYYKHASHIAHADQTIFKNKWMEPFIGNEFKRLTNLGYTIKLLRIVNELIFWIGLELAKFVRNEPVYDIIFNRYTNYKKDIIVTHNYVATIAMNGGRNS